MTKATSNSSLPPAKTSVLQLAPILFGFFIMGFVDVVGIATNYVKKGFRPVRYLV